MTLMLMKLSCCDNVCVYDDKLGGGLNHWFFLKAGYETRQSLGGKHGDLLFRTICLDLCKRRSNLRLVSYLDAIWISVLEAAALFLQQKMAG